jgi:hypothetical protein
MVGGQVMREGFTVTDIDYTTLRNVAIIKIIGSYDKIIFMMATKG